MWRKDVWLGSEHAQAAPGIFQQPVSRLLLGGCYGWLLRGMLFIAIYSLIRAGALMKNAFTWSFSLPAPQTLAAVVGKKVEYLVLASRCSWVRIQEFLKTVCN